MQWWERNEYGTMIFQKSFLSNVILHLALLRSSNHDKKNSLCKLFSMEEAIIYMQCTHKTENFDEWTWAWNMKEDWKKVIVLVLRLLLTFTLH